MQTYWGMELELLALLTSELGGSDWLDSRRDRFILEERTPLQTRWASAVGTM
jgi:hypothetical protein